jgi:hypothetical protein
VASGSPEEHHPNVHPRNLPVAVLVVVAACTGSIFESPFEGGRYAFDGSPPVHRGEIVSVTVEPIPEGPTAPVFVRHPRGEPFVSRELDLSELLPFVPDPLPATLDQGGCEFGGDLVIVTGQRTIAYGPCERPATINDLWGHFLAISTRGECLPDCGPVDKTNQ